MRRFLPALVMLLACSASEEGRESESSDVADLDSAGDVAVDAGESSDVNNDVAVDATPDVEPDPEPVVVADKTIHRLNRAEYDNTVRDLFGTSLRPSADFPDDDVAHGFDNIADVLTLSPVHIELYATAARRVIADALRPESPSRDELLVCLPSNDAPAPEIEGCLTETMAEFLPRAWRRPVSEEELARLTAFGARVLDDRDTFEVAVAMMMEAALASPNFVFRVEHHASLAPDQVAAGEVPWLDDFALASRLSYFLWSSMPDAELFELAGAGELQNAEEIERQVRRMLEDSRAEALVENFAGQWLYLRNIDRAAPDVWSYPEFTDELRASMRQEMELFFATFISEDRSMLELLTADDSFVDPVLAAHYGLDDFAGDGFERVYFSGVPRGGLLGQSGILMALSYPTRTSPVRRGKFILGQLLCQEPPPPPAGVEGLPETEDVEGLSLRERMERHRDDPTCASCHATMDPLGFGLENYDGVGRWRDFYGEDPVDAMGLLPDGREFDGGQEMATLIAADPAFPRCVSQTLFVYANGRGIELADRHAVAQISAEFEESDYRFADLAVSIATSVPFRARPNTPQEAE